ncbi:MAG: UDP-3-O-(3-hydroxymyristoyl)glucosamine N-acyltransferase [Gemmatimonadaceae bacterium]
MSRDVTGASLGGDEGTGKTGPSLTAEAIARLVGGTVRGNGEVRVRGVAPLDRATSDDLSFLAQQRYAPLFERSAAGVVLVSPDLADVPGDALCRIVVRQPHEAMLRVLPELYPDAPRERGIHATAVVGRGVRLGDGVAIGPYAVIGDHAQLGNDVVVAAHVSIGAGAAVGAQSWLAHGVTLYPGTVLGERVRVHAGARLGCDGFGYVPGESGHRKIPHVGRCIIGDDVEIGANSTIDRGSVDDTVIGAGTKIDNLVQIAHNVRIGRLCLIMAQVGVAGSVHMGDGCILAGQVGVSGHHTIGDGARLAAQAGVFGDIPAGETWSGYPARPHGEMLRAHAALFKLSGLMRRIEKLLDKGDA